MKVENAARGESVTAILAETEALQRQSQAKAFANTEALDLSGLTAANKKTKADSDASNAARKAENSVPIDDSVRADLEARYRAGTLTAADLATATTNAEAQKNNYAVVVHSPGSADLAGLHDALSSTQIAASILSKVQDLIRGPLTGTIIQARAGGGAAAAPAPAPSPVVAAPSVPKVGPSSVPAVGSTQHTVTINLAGGQQTTFGTASAEDSVKVMAFLKTLENSARSAGY